MELILIIPMCIALVSMIYFGIKAIINGERDIMHY